MKKLFFLLLLFTCSFAGAQSFYGCTYQGDSVIVNLSKVSIAYTKGSGSVMVKDGIENIPIDQPIDSIIENSCGDIFRVTSAKIQGVLRSGTVFAINRLFINKVKPLSSGSVILSVNPRVSFTVTQDYDDIMTIMESCGSGSGAPTGTSGGDLTGSYPNPTVAASKITSAKVLDETLTTDDLDTSSVNTLEIVDGGVATADLATNAVTTIKITDANVTYAKLSQAVKDSISAGAAPSGSAGGDLTGAYPNPTIGSAKVVYAYLIQAVKDSILQKGAVAANSVLGNATGSNAAPTYGSLVYGQLAQAVKDSVLQKGAVAANTILGNHTGSDAAPTYGKVVYNDLIQAVKDTFAGLSGFIPGSVIIGGTDGTLDQDNTGFAYDPTNNFLCINCNGSASVTELQVVTTGSSDPRGIMSSQFSTDALGARYQLRKARGTFASPTTIVTGDILGRIRASGYDGSNFLQMGSIEFGSSGTVAATRIPTYIAFSTGTDAAPSVLTEAMRIDNAQRVGIGGTPVSRLTIPIAPVATANFGSLSMGSGPFDGSTSGFYTGNAQGTQYAINMASGSTADFANWQVAGVPSFKLASTGTLSLLGDIIDLGAATANIKFSGTTTTRYVTFQTGSTTQSIGGVGSGGAGTSILELYAGTAPSGTVTISEAGKISLSSTITAGGTTGAQTINKPAGQVNFAAGASTLVVTNSLVSTSSIVIVQVLGTDTTAVYARVTKASGSFTITLPATATAETAVEFIVFN